jgi:ubiquinone/menaquinone biosynthesis C-methylase UbiE
MLRPITERLLVSAGVESGMRVLDIGCGPGDVSMLIADRVGPTGHVIGIDSSAEAIDAARLRCVESGRSNVEFLVGGLDTYDATTMFDAAVCRYVLIHQAEPSEFLRSAGRLVRPGGVIALHEMDITRGIQSYPRVPHLHEIYDAVVGAFLRAGTAFDVGGRLVRVFADAGLPPPKLFSQTIVERGEDTVLLRWMTELAREVCPQLFADGTEGEIQAQIDAMSDLMQHAASEMNSQIEFVPQTCAWTRV